MEKLYALLEENRHCNGSENVLIINLNQKQNNGEDVYYCENDIVYSNVFIIPIRAYVGRIKKVADNILDLIEVGDLVEVLFTGNEAYYKLEVLELTPNTIRLSHLTLNVSSFKSSTYSKDDINIRLPFCKTIFKLLPNGDYKKYEVR